MWMICGVIIVSAALACGSRRDAAAPAAKASAMEPRKSDAVHGRPPGYLFYWRAKRSPPAAPGHKDDRVQITIADITNAFPDYRVAVVVAEGLTIAPERPAALDALIAEREAAARARWSGTELSQIPGVAAWRAAYKAFGIKQTRYRSSVERLVKNVLAGRSLARVNALRRRSTMRCRWHTCCRSAPTTSTR